MERPFIAIFIASAMTFIGAGINPLCANPEDDLTTITNSISSRLDTFNGILSGSRPRRAIARAIYCDIASITNTDHRIVAARHFANEVLHINLSNENYRIRGNVLTEMPSVISYAWEALTQANTTESEQLQFLFDALEYFKYGCYNAHGEEPISEPLYGDYGQIMQRTYIHCAPGLLEQAKTHLAFTYYDDIYPNLSPEGKEYFQTRYRAIFGNDFEMPQK